MLTMLIFVDMSSRNPYSQIPSNFAYSCLAPPTCKFFRGVSVESPWAPPGPKNVIFPYAYNGIIFCVSEFSNTWQWNSSKLCSQLYGTANLWILQRRPGWIILGPPRAKNVIFPYAYNVNFCRQEFEKSWQWNYSKLCLKLSCPNNLRIFQGRPGWITLGPPGPKNVIFPYAYNGIIFCVKEFSKTWQWNSSKLCSQLYGPANLWIFQGRPGWIILGPPRAKNVIFPLCLQCYIVDTSFRNPDSGITPNFSRAS
jgi:hypothetical protein